MMVDWEIDEIEEMDQEEAQRFLSQKFQEYKYEVDKVGNFWAILGVAAMVTTFAGVFGFTAMEMTNHAMASLIATFVSGGFFHFFGDYKEKQISTKATKEYRELKSKVKEKTKKR